jgi:leader peptidase (prepilin peptidase)/N-methyltransferase
MSYLAAFIVGTILGSFLNVCVHRLPRRESIIWPASRCPACGQPIAVRDNVPVLSYIWLGGRCRACQAPISGRYPLVELANGLGYGLLLWQFGAAWPTLIYAVLFSALLVVTAIDLEHQIIPDAITLPGIGVGLLAASTVLPVGFGNSVAGILVGGGLLWILAWVSPYLFGKEGMGGGDIKLLAMIGAFLGWRPVLLAVMVGAVAGSVVGLTLIGLRLLRRDEYIPFGPFLALGAVVALFFYQELLSWYLGLFAR